MTTDVPILITDSTPSRRRRFRFSMRSLLVVTTLAGCFFGWVAKERRQSEFEKRIGKTFLAVAFSAHTIHSNYTKIANHRVGGVT